MRFAPLVLTALALTACGGHAAHSPEQVARAWSAALNRGDDAAAGRLFAKGARVVQDQIIVLPDTSAAMTWNHALPCGGTILSVDREGTNGVLVVFRLEHRPGHACDAPGQKAAAVFRVVRGRITLWHQVPPPSAAPVV